MADSSYLKWPFFETRHAQLAQELDAWAAQHGLTVVPQLAAGRLDMAQLRTLVSGTPSRFRDGPLEGVVLRQQNSDWLLARAKLVRSDFTQAIESHWRNRAIEWNQLDRSHSATPQEAAQP